MAADPGMDLGLVGKLGDGKKGDPRKEFRLYLDGERVIGDIPLYIGDPISMNFTQHYSELFQTQANPIGDFMSQIADQAGQIFFGKNAPSVSAHNKYFGFQQWQGSDPVSFNVTITLHQGIAGKHDAYEEVYLPLMALASISLPYEDTDTGVLTTPNTNLLNLLGAGVTNTVEKLVGGEHGIPPDVGVNVNKTSSATFNDSSAGKLLNGDGPGRGNHYMSIRIGNQVFMPWAILKQVEVQMGKEVDQNGFSITGTATLSFSSAFAATKSMIKFWADQAKIAHGDSGTAYFDAGKSGVNGFGN